jgi:polysaccharide biosynthesis transport protein
MCSPKKALLVDPKMNGLKVILQNPQIVNFLNCYWHWRKLWILSTATFCALGLSYAVLLKRDTWVASQALMVRDEATGGVMRLGRFESQTQMKTAQETILEMARNPLVVGNALKAIGRAPRLFGLITNTSDPTKSEIDDFARNCVVVRAPRGAELGTTEVIYLDVKQKSQERAIKLATALCDALEFQLKSVRVERASSVIQELQAGKEVAESSLADATSILQRMEIEAGSDLADLRGLSDSNAGNMNNLMLDSVRDELRKADLSIRNMAPNIELAKLALQDPNLLLQAAEVLTQTHPVLGALRDGLSKAMMETATLEGRYTTNHPDVLSAKNAELAFRNNIRAELSKTVQSCETSIAITQQKIDALNQQEIELGKRLSRLAELRSRYSNQLAEVRSRREKLSQIDNDLTETVASRSAAQAASLLTRLDSPVLGEKPIGPGRTTIVGGSTVGGLLLGLGVVFLLVPLDGAAPRPQLPEFLSRKKSSQPIPQPEANGVPSNSNREPDLAANDPGAAATRPAEATISQSAPSATAPKPPRTGAVGQVFLQDLQPATSASAAARNLAEQHPQEPDPLDDVRAMIARALNSHNQDDSSLSNQ